MYTLNFLLATLDIFSYDFPKILVKANEHQICVAMSLSHLSPLWNRFCQFCFGCARVSGVGGGGRSSDTSLATQCAGGEEWEN